MKIKWLRESINENDFIILITYSETEDKLFFDSSKNKLGTNLFIKNIEDEEGIIKIINFINEIKNLNKGLECL